ncbi:DUF927 domain-containing protein [Commensalibacter nepenthis]|uniref:DUF927 domain-containing protein n=1 Tax=Commensalibacter nepenthis TaxID=3043872 RepID=A0ABT6Q5G3_9PROT|nr:DUF927 domain-containing protein [Commensalibacter sp. TBRC 10068]MDI2112131.1 DUF927 domain-containing protein [Commensalibacter sp. TBRC 10068]
MLDKVNSSSTCVEQELIWEPIIPAPNEPNKPSFASSMWVYRDANNNPLMARLRIKKSHVKKDFLPMTYGHRVWIDKHGNKQDQTKWHFKEPNSVLPLYGLEILTQRPTDPILIVEGEKTADAARILFPDYVVMTSQGGSHGASRNDWSVLKDKSIIIWPDHDQAGEDYAKNLIEILYEIGIQFLRKVALPTDLPNGWDLANPVPQDCLKSNQKEHDYLTHLLNNAQPIEKPIKIMMPSGYKFYKDGLYYTNPSKDDALPVKICDPFTILGATEDKHGANCGLYIAWINQNSGTEHTYSIPRSLIHSNGNEIPATLEGKGLACLIAGRKLLLNFISQVRINILLRSTHKTGWHHLNNQALFMMPNGKVIGSSSQTNSSLILQTGNIHQGQCFTQSGSLSDWQEQIGRYLVGNSRLLFFACASLAGSLLEITYISGGGLHLIGKSQSGKSTALFVAASIWGKGARDGQVRSWRHTGNGLEGIANETSDLCLILDEFGEASAKEIGDIIYMLANGIGKGRANQLGNARSVKTWRSIFLSSGEVMLDQKMGEDQRSSKMGQKVRFMEIPADAGANMGLFEDIHEFKEAGLFASYLQTQSAKFYGTVGLAFIESLCKARQNNEEGFKQQLIQAIEQRTQALLSKNTTSKDGAIRTIAQRCALIEQAGLLAIEYGIFPFDQNMIIQSTEQCFKDWINHNPNLQEHEEKQMILHIKHYLETHGANRFIDMTFADTDRTPHRVGYKKKNTNGVFDYLILAQNWEKDMCKGFNAKEVAKALMKTDLLEQKEGVRPNYKLTIPSIGLTRIYHIKASIMEYE